MMRNVGTVDRWIRMFVGVGLVAGAFFVEGDWRWMAAPGSILILTSIIRFCPAYSLLRLKTGSVPKSVERRA